MSATLCREINARAALLPVVLLLAASCIQAATPKPVVIEQPTGGEVYVIGTDQTIRTATKPKYKTVRIELSRDGGASFPEVLGTIDNAATDKALRYILNWTVAGPASDGCVIKAVGILRDLSEVESLSAPFSIGNIDVDTSSPDSRYVQVAGDTMTGLLVLSDDPSANLGAATKQYVDSANSTQDTAISGKVSKSGDTMTGNLTMGGNKVTGLGAASANGEAVRFEQAVKSGDSAGGDLTGTYPSPTVDASKVQKRVTGTAPAGEFITGINQDGTVSSAAAVGGVPSGSGVLGETPTPPSGFSYSGFSIDVMNKWRPRQPMPAARSDFGIGVVGGKIYIIGGHDGTSATGLTEEYDPVANTWATKAPMPTAREMPAVAEAGGKLYAIGGLFTFSVNQEYDPVANTWSTKEPMPTPRGGAAAISLNGKIYVIGGANNTSTLGTNEVYDPSTNTWATKSPMPTVRGGSGAAAVNGKIYVIGGGSGTKDVVEEYDPVDDSWATKSNMPTPRDGLSCAEMDGVIYAIGGENGSGSVPTVEVYSPINDYWSTKLPMPTERHSLGVCRVNAKIYAIGGYQTSTGRTAVNEEFSIKLFHIHTKD